ncbi:MAG: hypothetical protein ACTHU0_19105 [Kofleriaceae bacterium]
MLALRRYSLPVIIGFAAVYLILTAAWQIGISRASADTVALVDAGPPPHDAGSALETPAAPSSDPLQADPGDLALEMYRGVETGDWWIFAGAALSLLAVGVFWALDKRWPGAVTGTWKLAIVAALAGAGALGHAWIASADLTARTLLGALKVWAAAALIHATAKQALGASKSAPSGDAASGRSDA